MLQAVFNVIMVIIYKLLGIVVCVFRVEILQQVFVPNAVVLDSL